MIRIFCHNCGKEVMPETKEAVLANVNKIQVKFCNVFCFKKWNDKYKEKYKGGLISDMENKDEIQS